MSADQVMREHLGQLVGRKVTGLVKDPGDGVEPIWGLKFDDGTMAFILCDPEGNGPGHLEIQKG
jgi:hypothetical protein